MTSSIPLDCEDEVFSGLDLAGQQLERRDLVGCTFKRCTFSGARLLRWTLEDCRFEDCDLSLVKLSNSTVRDVHFLDCKLTGIDWSEAYKLTFGVKFSRCTLDFGSFLDLPLRRLHVIGGSATEAQFADSDLRNSRFDGVKLDGASFLRCDLRGVNFAGSEGVGLGPSCRLGKTTLGMNDALAHLHRLGIAVDMS